MLISFCLLVAFVAELSVAHGFRLLDFKVRRQFEELGGPLSPDSEYLEDGIVTLEELKQLLILGGISASEADYMSVIMMDQNDWNGDGVLDGYELGFQEDIINPHPNAT